MEHEFQKVSNIEFANTITGSIFRCLMEDCTFASNENRVFENHLRLHLNDGGVRENSSFCKTCAMPINAENVCGEFLHVMKRHARKVEITVKQEAQTTVLQQDISTDEGPTDDEESENVVHTNIEALKPMEFDIKEEVIEDYEEFFENVDMDKLSKSIRGTSEIPALPQVVSTVPQTHASPTKDSKSTEPKSNEPRSPSRHRSTSSREKKSSSSTDKSKLKSKSSSRKTSSSQSSESRSEKKSDETSKSDKKKKSSGKNHSSSSSSKSHGLKNSSKNSSSSCEKAESSEILSHPKRNASRSPSHGQSPDKKVRLEIENTVIERAHVEVEPISNVNEKTPENLSQERIENAPFDSKSDVSISIQHNMPSTSTSHEGIDKSTPPEKRMELQSEFGTIPFKKIIGKIPKKIPVVISCLVEDPSAVHASNQSVVKSSPVETEPTPIRINAADLMPWAVNLKRENFKFEKSLQLMTTKQALVNLYKCMDANCSFTNSNYKCFLSHLETHAKEPSDTRFYQMCPYCRFQHAKSSELATHIQRFHSFDRYQCRFCFFRSQERGTVCEHHSIQHHNSSTPILQCPGSREKSQQEVETREYKLFQLNANREILCKCEFSKKLLKLICKLIFCFSLSLEAAYVEDVAPPDCRPQN